MKLWLPYGHWWRAAAMQAEQSYCEATFSMKDLPHSSPHLTHVPSCTFQNLPAFARYYCMMWSPVDEGCVHHDCGACHSLLPVLAGGCAM